jgi:hypothetical protein
MRRLSPCWFLLLLLAAPAASFAQESLTGLVRRVKPAVVLITAFDERGAVRARGTGFLVGANQVVTNWHVIEGAARAEVKTSDGKGKAFPVEGVLASDYDGDLVLLRAEIPTTGVKTLTVESHAPLEGERIMVVGNPLRLEWTVSDGIVSAVREIPSFGRVIQITAPIAHGSSGSPVVNMQGQVIGVVTMQIVNAQDISLAVSVDRFAALRPGPLRTLAEWDGGPSKSRIARPVARWMYSTGLELLWRSNYEDALGYFEKAADKEADRAETWLQIGYCRANLNQHEAAIRAYRRAIRLKPDYTEAYNKLGDAYYCTGQRREAVEAYRKVVELNPGIASAHYNLGLTQLELGNRQAALEQHKLLLTLDPGLAGELYRLIEK